MKKHMTYNHTVDKDVKTVKKVFNPGGKDQCTNYTKKNTNFKFSDSILNIFMSIPFRDYCY